MSKNRVIYNTVAIYAGTVPSSGFHFIDQSGILVNSQYSNTGNIVEYSSNTIRSLNRVVAASYSFQESRSDIKSIGNFGTLARPILATPPVSLNFSCYSMGLINESILGLTISSGSNITPISGYLNRINQYQNLFDSRNIFIATNDNNLDLNYTAPVRQTINSTTADILKENIFVYAFGDCFLDSYKYSAAVGQFPQVDTSFTCNNVIYYSGGSGHTIPSVNPQNFSLRTGITYNLPPAHTGIQASILLPGDITIDISESNGTNYIQNLPIDFRDIKIQGFNIDLNLKREPLTNLGYRVPMDRPINPPVFANLGFSAIVGDSETGSLIDFINNDTNYDISINMRYSHQPVSGVGINFKFLGAKFNDISASESISQKRMANFSFSSELSPNSSTKGFFISGQLGEV